jgi:acetoin utilization protein AcuC
MTGDGTDTSDGRADGLALLVASPIYRAASFGNAHPLSFPRMATLFDLCDTLGWLASGRLRQSRQASVRQLMRYHDRAYIEALKAADRTGQVDRKVREQHHIGSMENPLFSGVYQQAATSVGGSILAAELALEGRVVFHPAGGTHHGRPDRASGFCYFNDPVFAVMTLLDHSVAPVLYVDLDAHHGDAVQDAFELDKRVFSVSIHEENRWPYSGAIDDRGGGQARNLPVPEKFNDSELDFLMVESVLPLAQRFAPQAIVITCGADGLDGDPLSRMALSNVALWQAVEQLTRLVPSTVVLGGGGYNPWTLARCWAGLWARLSKQPIPTELPAAARRLLRSLECDLVDLEDVQETWCSRIVDLPRPGVVRAAVKSIAATVLH